MTSLSVKASVQDITNPLSLFRRFGKSPSGGNAGEHLARPAIKVNTTNAKDEYLLLD